MSYGLPSDLHGLQFGIRGVNGPIIGDLDTEKEQTAVGPQFGIVTMRALVPQEEVAISVLG